MTSYIVTDTAHIGLALSKAPDATVIAISTPEVAQAVAATGARVLHVTQGDVPVEAYAPAVASYLKEQGADTVIGVDTPGGRALATAAAVALNASFVSRVVTMSGDEITRNIAAIAEETQHVDGARVVVMQTAPVEATGEGSVEALDLASSYVGGMTVLPDETAEVDITTATRVVAAGRGFKAQEDLSLLNDLAGKIDAVTACSRPLAEGVAWFPKQSYVGISGRHIQPELYVAVGISGQIQHTAGVLDSQTIIAINKDADAPIFKDADYGIVGDLYEVLPSLIDAVS